MLGARSRLAPAVLDPSSTPVLGVRFEIPQPFRLVQILDWSDDEEHEKLKLKYWCPSPNGVEIGESSWTILLPSSPGTD